MTYQPGIAASDFGAVHHFTLDLTTGKQKETRGVLLDKRVKSREEFDEADYSLFSGVFDSEDAFKAFEKSIDNADDLPEDDPVKLFGFKLLVAEMHTDGVVLVLFVTDRKSDGWIYGQPENAGIGFDCLMRERYGMTQMIANPYTKEEMGQMLDFYRTDPNAKKHVLKIA